MHPAVPSPPALFVAAAAQHAGQLRLQGAEEDKVLGPSLDLLHRGGVDGRSVSEQEMRARGRAQRLGEPGGRVGVELVGFVEIVGARLAGREVQRRFAAEGPGVDATVDEVGAPRRGVARGEEADGHGGGGRLKERVGWRLGEVMGRVLGTEVGEDRKRGRLVRCCCQVCYGEVEEKHEREEEMASSTWVWVVGRGGREEVSGDDRSDKEVERGEEGVDEADLLVGDEGQN